MFANGRGALGEIARPRKGGWAFMRSLQGGLGPIDMPAAFRRACEGGKLRIYGVPLYPEAEQESAGPAPTGCGLFTWGEQG